jgi:ketosteroid isomerase-like protein
LIALANTYSLLGADQGKDVVHKPRRKNMSTPSQDEHQLVKLVHEWAEATLKHDASAGKRFKHDDWVLTDPEGNVWTKEQEAHNLGSGNFKFDSLKIDDVKVRIHGDTAVVTGSASVSLQIPSKATASQVAHLRGQSAGGQFRFTDVFVRAGEGWQALASQITAVAHH